MAALTGIQIHSKDRTSHMKSIHYQRRTGSKAGEHWHNVVTGSSVVLWEKNFRETHIEGVLSNSGKIY